MTLSVLETQVEPLTTASRPSLRHAAGLAMGRRSYKPHLAVISAPPSSLPAGTLTLSHLVTRSNSKSREIRLHESAILIAVST